MMEQQDTAESTADSAHATCISIGIIAWNEEKAIRSTLESLFQQSLFDRVGRMRPVAKSSVSRTVARRRPDRHRLGNILRTIRASSGAVVPVAEIKERGKANAWNVFVHRLSAPEARFLFLMDADIGFRAGNPLEHAYRPRGKSRRVHCHRPALQKHLLQTKTSPCSNGFRCWHPQMTQAGEAQLCGQLYCIRSEIARRIFSARGFGLLRRRLHQGARLHRLSDAPGQSRPASSSRKTPRTRSTRTLQSGAS